MPTRECTAEVEVTETRHAAMAFRLAFLDAVHDYYEAYGHDPHYIDLTVEGHVDLFRARVTIREEVTR